MSEGKPKTGLTPRQRRFVEEYVVDENGVQAYFRAFGRVTRGGRPRSYWGANTEARALLQNPSIVAELERVREAYRERVRVSKARVLRELALVAFADLGDAHRHDPATGQDVPLPLTQIPTPTRRAIQASKTKRRRIAQGGDEVYEVEEVEYKLASKLDALDKLCKKLGFYTDQPAAGGDKAVIEVEANGRDSIPPAE